MGIRQPGVPWAAAAGQSPSLPWARPLISGSEVMLAAYGQACGKA